MSPRRKLDTDQLYTSAETREKLGISPSTLTTLVEKGVIEKVTPVGYKNGFYTKASVDEYAKQQNIFLQTYTSKKERALEVRKATAIDQEGIYEMEREVLGVTIPLETRLIWHHKNPDIDFIAVSNGKIVGHLSLVPLPEGILWRKIRREISGKDMGADDIEAYEPRKQYNLYIMAMAVQQSGTPTGRMHAGLLMREAQKSLFEMAWQGKLIRAMYAASRTRDGIYMCERMEFTPQPEYSDAHFKSFVMDMGASNASWAKEYRECLASMNLPTELTAGILNNQQETIAL